tara:strand:- start:650 stop:952 length:303 start_codon:yes stop_codon:yes gene_type:complete
MPDLLHGTHQERCTYKDFIVPHSIELDAILAPEGNEETYFIAQMRTWRDALLAQSDWTQMADAPLTDDEKRAWATYRQALRDYPSTWTPAGIADFPDPPS